MLILNHKCTVQRRGHSRLPVPGCQSPHAGFTIIEILISTFIIGTVVVGLFALFFLNLRSAQEGERKIVAVALANERMEMIRNLPYEDVGTAGGAPAGSIPQSETVVRNGQTFTVGADIRYVDDPYDGEITGGVEEEGQTTICHTPPGGGGEPQTITVGTAALDAHLAHGDTVGACEGGEEVGEETYNADYKQVRVAVDWLAPFEVQPVVLITYVAPQGIEGGELGGTLDFQALDSAGNAVTDATVVLLNDTTDPPLNITTQTNSEGRLVLPGLEPSADSYELSVAKDGFTSERTYDTTATFFPSPDYTHLSMIAQEITGKTFFIDQAATLNVSTVDDADPAQSIANVAYTLRGTKTIGQDDEGSEVHTVNESAQTDSGGDATHAELVWDSYQIIIDGAATGYDIKETSVPLPFTLQPGGTVDLTVTLVDHTDRSLRVTVVNEDGEPVDNATVSLTGNGIDESLGTGAVGQVFFADLPVNGTYTLEVDAPNFEIQTLDAEVAETSQATVELVASS